MKIDRRKFIVLSTAAAVMPSSTLLGADAPAPSTGLSAAPAGNPPGGEAPWHQRVRRLGQVNFNERDPIELDVERWADTWAELKVDGVFVSVTGIIAFYPTKVPFFRRSRYLGNRDLFGECCAAAKKRGIRVIARYSPDLQWGDALKAHPEWFRRNAAGKPAGSSVPDLYQTCSFTDYYTEQMPAIMREVNSRYDVDAIYTNAWPNWGDPPRCYCAACQSAPEPGTPEYSERYLKRTLELWHLFNSIAQEKRPDNIFLGNLGGGVAFGLDARALATECHWFNCDNQGRHGATPAWKCAQQGRVAYSVMKGRTTTNVIGSWATGAVQWRNTAKAHDEAMLWMAQTAASGMRVWYHWLGAQGGLGLDHRWPEAGREFFTWQAKHDEHFSYRKPIADLGVVWSQRSNKRSGETEFMEGLYAALVQGRFAFDLVHEDDFGAERLRQYRALILPNVTVLNDAQCAQLRAYAQAGGSLLATFETSLYADTTGAARSNFGLADVFGISRDGEVIRPVSNFGSYARIRQPKSELLRGIRNTELLPAGEYVVPVTAEGLKPILTVVPAYSGYPPEMCYAPPGADTQRPLFVPREKGDSRRLYIASDLERCAWRSCDADLSQLLHNAIRWVTRDRSLLRVEGEGVVEIFGWETDAGFAVHLLNYTNPNLYRAGISRFYPVGPQTVTLEVPGGGKIARVQLLRAEEDVPFKEHDRRLEFTVPSVTDYEVAAITRA
jgi:Hypothetical glycosyl hydrolase 6/Beta-galactosidase trimerisation domain